MVDADGIFAGMLKITFQETSIIPVHVVAKGNHKEIINKEFNLYLKKFQKINAYEKGSLHQWLHGVFFALY